MASQTMIPVLVTLMLLTGVCNTLLTKYQDLQCVHNCSAPNARDREYFEQPVLQTAQMFVGEAGCFLVLGLIALFQHFSLSRSGYTPIASSSSAPLPPAATKSSVAPLDPSPHGGRIALRGWRIVLLALPSCCDIAGTTLMNVGLLFVAASIYQMTRGALVLFVGVFSVWFLKRRLAGYKWFALVVVMLGVGIVGLAGAIQDSPQAKPSADVPRLLVRVLREARAEAASPEALQTVLGVLMIAGAQIFTATQFVLEESIMERYAIAPLAMVGWEGLFGFLVTALGMVVLHILVGSTPAGAGGYFDAREGWRQMVGHPRIALSSLLIMFSIGGFNFFGLSVTRSVSATARSTIDTCRTLFIWIVSLGLGWETFKPLQIVGFAGLVYGTFLFNDVVGPPWGRWVKSRAGSGAPLLAADAGREEGEAHP